MEDTASEPYSEKKKTPSGNAAARGGVQEIFGSREKEAGREKEGLTMVNALGQVNMSAGTPVRNKENECRGSMVFECHSRKATPEELERYFGDKPKKQADETPKMKAISKDELLERLHPTHKEPEPQEPEPDEPEKTLDSRRLKQLDRLLAAASKVTKRQYKTMKAAVMIIGKVNGWE